MKNNDIFTAEGYDMVVCITQQSINDQLAHMANPDIGSIKTDFIMELTVSDDGETFIPVFHDDFSQVEKDPKGLPINPCIDGQYQPSVTFTASGGLINLVLTFTSGTAFMRNPVTATMMPGKDMTGWAFGISIDLDFASISNEDVEKGLPVPAVVAKSLHDFTSAQFSVASLLIDFDSTDLLRFNPELTTVGNASTVVQNAFVLFVGSYLGAIGKDPKKNPYILGYALTQTPQTVNPDKDVPPSLRPVGNTFSVYHDPDNIERSTLNFCMNTMLSGGQLGAGTHASPGIFDSNWIDKTEQCDGKMVYSTFCFLETLILRPFYDAYKAKSHDKISNAGLNIGDFAPYDQARQVQSSGTGLHFAIYNVSGTDDDCTNTMDVTWTTIPTGVAISITGNISCKKTKSKNMFFCTATAWGSANQSWNTTINVDYDYDPQTNKPSLKPTDPPIIHVTSFSQDSWKNDCAKAWGTIGEILGGILDLFTAFQDGNFFQDMFTNLMTNPVGGLPPIDLSLQAINSANEASFMLPAGDEFMFKNVAVLPEGSTTMELTFKTSTSGLKALRTVQRDVIVTETRFARIRAPQGKASQKSRQMANGSLAKPRAPSHVKNTLSINDSVKTTTSASSLGDPMMDKFSVKSTNNSLPQSIDLSVSCELMNNSQSGMPVAPSSDMIALQDILGNPMIFTIGTDSRLNILIGTSGESVSGWSTRNCLDSFPNYTSAVAFDAIQDVNGLISLAFALRNSKTSAVDVFFASLLSSDLTITDFGKLSTFAPLITGVDPKFVAESIRLGSSDDGKRPMCTIEGSLNSKHLLYQLDSTDQSAKELELPEGMTPGVGNLIGHCAGFSFGQRSNLFLYNIAQVRHLIARTTADLSIGSLVYDYSPGELTLPDQFQRLTYNCIQTAIGRPGPVNTASDIYIGSPTGVYRIPNGKSSAMELVSSAIVDVHDIVVTTDGDDISVWVTNPKMLYYIYGRRASGTTRVAWNMPIAFATGVLRVAPFRSATKKANELFTLMQDSSITHYWQDPSSTSWRSRTTLVKNDAYVLNFNSYTTHVHAENEGVPATGATFKITSSEWQYCTINGLVFSLDADIPAEVELDPQGNITIISTAVDISPPVLHLQSDIFAETINIYPNGKVHTHLQTVTTGDSLRAAKCQDGTPVLPVGTDPNITDGIASNISNLSSVALKDVYPPTQAGNTFVVVENPQAPSPLGIKHTLAAAMPTNHFPQNFSIGMRLQSGKWVPHTAATAKALTVSRLSVSDLTDWAGDVWHHLESLGDLIINGLKDTEVFLSNGINFLIDKVDDVWQFLLTIGDQVIKIALKTFVAAFKALNFIFGLIGIDLTKFLKWIGHLLGFDKIWDTHKMLAATMKVFVDYGATVSTKYLENLRTSVKDELQTLDQKLKTLILPDSIKNASAAQVGTTVPVGGPRADFNSPQANFAMYHLNHSQGSGDGATVSKISKMMNGVNGVARATNGTNSNNPLTQLLDDVIIPLGNTIAEKLSKDGNDLVNLIKSGSMDAFRQVVFDLADTIIDVLGQLIDGVLHFIEYIIGDVQALLEDEIEIPLITALYDGLSELFGDGEKFTVLNGLAFIISIPVVVIMEIANLGSPVDLNTVGFTDPNFPATVDAMIHGSSRSNARTVSAKKARVLASADAADVDYDALNKASGSFGLFVGVVGVAQNIIQNVQSLSSNDKLSAGILIAKSVFGMPYPSGPDQNWTSYVFRWISFALTSGYGALTVIPKTKAAFVPGPGSAETQDQYMALGSVVMDFLGFAIAIACDAMESGTEPLIWTADVTSNIGGMAADIGTFMGEESEIGPILKVVGSFVAGAGGGFAVAGAIESLDNQHGWLGVNIGGCL
ncbi:hypothetical protein LTS15_007628 [Exophiala xenobiotica]|nr:hypothetical protein LTS15_007628 [Exophiala xenobiotica]